MKSLDRTLTDERLFKTQLVALASFFQIEEINLNPFIYDRTVQLFRLWQIIRGVGSDKLDWVENGWVLVALRLGFIKNTAVAAKELRTCYNQLLKDLEYIKDDYDEEPDWLTSQP